MTLIIAGHSLQQGACGRKSDYITGLFAASDSNITSGNTVLVSGFKKVIEIPIRIKALNFNGEWFNGYLGHRYEGQCFVAFAGSTLVAQHIINSIRNHLGDLYPTYEQGQYQLVMLCEECRHLEQGYYAEDMFLDAQLNPLLTADYMAGVVSHAIQAVLDQAKRHEGMKTRFSAFQAEFIFGARCPVASDYHLYQYEIIPDGKDGALVKMTNVPVGELAIIGLREECSDEAKLCFERAIEGGNNTAAEMHRFVAQKIASKNEIGIFSIGKPCGLYKYDGGKLEVASFVR